MPYHKQIALDHAEIRSCRKTNTVQHFPLTTTSPFAKITEIIAFFIGQILIVFQVQLQALILLRSMNYKIYSKFFANLFFNL